MHILIVFGTTEGHTAELAQFAADCLRGQAAVENRLHRDVMNDIRLFASVQSDEARERPQVRERIEAAAGVLERNQPQARASDNVAAVPHPGHDRDVVPAGLRRDGERQPMRDDVVILGDEQQQFPGSTRRVTVRRGKQSGPHECGVSTIGDSA